MRFLMGLLFLVVGVEVVAQNSGIRGKITSGGEPVPFANIYIETLNLGTTSKENGAFPYKTLEPAKNLNGVKIR